ncbi:putative Sulfotransferase domain-containing protein 3, partial [Homarus americanus]
CHLYFCSRFYRRIKLTLRKREAFGLITFVCIVLLNILLITGHLRQQSREVYPYGSSHTRKNFIHSGGQFTMTYNQSSLTIKDVPESFKSSAVLKNSSDDVTGRQFEGNQTHNTQSVLVLTSVGRSGSSFLGVGKSPSVSIKHPYTYGKTKGDVVLSRIIDYCKMEPLRIIKTIRTRLAWMKPLLDDKYLNLKDLEQRREMEQLYPDKYYFLKYEDLCRDPYGRTRDVFRFLKRDTSNEAQRGNASR